MPPPLHAPQYRVLFVCLGNICRSPLAEAVFLHLAEEEGFAARFAVESAGTGAWHVGEPPDSRSVGTARRHGITVTGAARQVTDEDFASFDLIVAMDRSNLDDLERKRERADGSARLQLLRECDPERSDGRGDDMDVPDPYYGGPEGFETVFDIVARSCAGLLASLRDDIEA